MTEHKPLSGALAALKRLPWTCAAKGKPDQTGSATTNPRYMGDFENELKGPPKPSQ